MVWAIVGGVAYNSLHDAPCEACDTNDMCASALMMSLVGKLVQEACLDPHGNWKNPGPLVLKYTRNRSSVPARMVQELVRDMLAQEHPVQESEDVFLDTPETLTPEAPEFFLKQPAPGSYYDYRYHCSHPTDPDRTACNKLDLADCNSMGTILPDVSVLCKACLKARPGVVDELQG